MPSTEQIIGNLHIIHERPGDRACRMIYDRLSSTKCISVKMPDELRKYEIYRPKELAAIINEGLTGPAFIVCELVSYRYNQSLRYGYYLYISKEEDAVAFKLKFN